MAKSRKVLLAVVLLAGGYGLALSFSSLAAAVARWTGNGSDQEAVGVLVPLEPSAAEAATTTLAAPLADFEKRPSCEPARVPGDAEPPTWLAAAPESEVAESKTEPTPRGALARVKNVTPWGPTASSGASPWDRWPAWEPTAAAPVGQRDSPTRHASFESSPGGPPDGAAAGFDDHDSAARRHVVVDGDSLARLADRYLDDPQRADEIYQLNRGVLSDPQLLPIGVELVIPDRRVVTVRRPPVEASVADAAPPSVPAPFVPIEGRTEPVHVGPRAQLLSPLPIGRDE